MAVEFGEKEDRIKNWFRTERKKLLEKGLMNYEVYYLKIPGFLNP